MKLLEKLTPWRDRRPPVNRMARLHCFGISNAEQDHIIASQRDRVIHSAPPLPVMVSRAAKPNSSRPQQAVVLFPERLPDITDPAFRYIRDAKGLRGPGQ